MPDCTCAVTGTKWCRFPHEVTLPAFDQLDDMVTCPACDRLQDEAECFLGRLGRLTHYRCRYCGMGFNSDEEWNARGWRS